MFSRFRCLLLLLLVVHPPTSAAAAAGDSPSPPSARDDEDGGAIIEKRKGEAVMARFTYVISTTYYLTTFIIVILVLANRRTSDGAKLKHMAKGAERECSSHFASLTSHLAFTDTIVHPTTSWFGEGVELIKRRAPNLQRRWISNTTVSLLCCMLIVCGDDYMSCSDGKCGVVELMYTSYERESMCSRRVIGAD